MRRKLIRNSPGLMLVLGGDGVEENGYVCTIYGCESHASTTLPLTSKVVQLSELLNDLEKRLETLESRYLEVCAMWNTDILPRVKRLHSIRDSIITKE